VIAQIKSELFKIRSTRTTLGLLIGMIVLILLITLLSSLLGNVASLTGAENQRQLLSVGSSAGIFSALAGVLLITSEYRYGTIRPTYLFTPRRSVVLTSKLAAGALAGLALGILGEGFAFGVGDIVLAARGIPLSLSGGSLTLLLLGTVAGVVLFGAFGVGLGAIIRNQVGCIIALLAMGFVVDNLLFGLVPEVGRFTPTSASDGLVGLTMKHLLPPVGGALVLIGWVALLALIALPLTSRRDIN
jgi:ABC-2 type transport system permease protein